jgi:hypothetical protein
MDVPLVYRMQVNAAILVVSFPQTAIAKRTRQEDSGLLIKGQRIQGMT